MDIGQVHLFTNIYGEVLRSHGGYLIKYIYIFVLKGVAMAPEWHNRTRSAYCTEIGRSPSVARTQESKTDPADSTSLVGSGRVKGRS